ncbi:MAG: hypothetical protein IKZ30_01875, partial [Oscillospiraceae bacterium]|nr:hypothetical protein [Oscillospiraceae bacterium]
MSGNSKYYIIAAVLLVVIIAIVLCIMTALVGAPSVPEEPLPTTSETPEIPQQTQEPEPTPEPTEEPEPTPTETLVYHMFTITVGEGGAAYPCGSIEVPNGEDMSILIEAAEGYEIAKVTFDGKNVRLLDAVSFTYDVPYVTCEHTFTVEFAAKPEPTPEPTPETTP